MGKTEVRFSLFDGMGHSTYDAFNWTDRPTGISHDVYVCPVSGNIWARIRREGGRGYCAREVVSYPAARPYARSAFALPGCLLPQPDAFDWDDRLAELPDALLSREFLNQTDPANMENSPTPVTAQDVVQEIAHLRVAIQNGTATMEQKIAALRLLRANRLSAATASAKSKAATVKPKVDGDAILKQFL